MDLDGALAATAYLGLRPEALCITDHLSQIVFAAPAFCTLFGYSDYREVVGRNVSELIDRGIDHPHGSDMTSRIREGGRLRFAQDGVVRGRKVDGTAFDVFIGERQMFPAGNRIFMSCVARLPVTD